MNFLSIKAGLPEVAPDIVFRILGWPISNSFLMSVLILLLFVGLGLYVRFAFKVRPGKAQTLLEIVYEWLVGLIAQIAGSREKAKAILPLIASVFFFIAFSNTIGLIPGLSSLTYDGIPIFRTPTTDFNTTFGLALGMIIIINAMSIYDYGIFGYLAKFVQVDAVWRGFRSSLKDGLFALVNFGIGLLDIISELAKVVSLSLRLFGNIYAGEVLMVVLLGAIAYAVPGLWLTVSTFFGLVQAVVFSALIAAYYGQARKP